MSNISLIEEANASFLNLSSVQEKKEPESYTDFLRRAQIDTLKEIFQIILGKEVITNLPE